VRTACGQRQQVVAWLGKLDNAQLAGLRGRWDVLPSLLRILPTSGSCFSLR